MRRRDFIQGIVGSAALWPIAAHAQQSDRMRHIGLLMNKDKEDPESKAEIMAFERGLVELGWKLGGNIQIDYRWAAGHADLFKKYAPELVALAPDVLVGVGGSGVGALQQATRTLPIVFVETTDPVNRGLVVSMAKPGGNTTGFVQFEFELCGKWLELLKQIAPSVSRVAVIRNPVQFSGVGELAVIQAAAASYRVEVSPIDARDDKEIERTIIEFAHSSNDALIVTPSGAADRNRKLIIALAAKLRLPTIYPYRFYVTAGGLISYGPDLVSQFHAATTYVDRILKGEKAADLAVQTPTKYELAINLKTAKALGITMPPPLLGRADAVIE